MGRCSIQIVMGPAGSGKSTYCSTMQQHCDTKRAGAGTAAMKHGIPTIHVANLDPAAEYFNYNPIFDIRDVISVEEVMTELSLGPNGALLYCMEYIIDHHLSSWLHDEIEAMGDDDYLFLDCPGQIELYTHIPIQKRIIDTIRQWGYDGRMVSVFCLDATFCCADAYKLISGNLLSLSTMIALELPHVTLLTKCDLISETEMERIMEYTSSASHIHQLEQNQQSLLYINDNVLLNNNNNTVESNFRHPRRRQQQDGGEDDDEDVITQDDVAASAAAAVTENTKVDVVAATTTQSNNNHKQNGDNNYHQSNDMEYLQQLETRRRQRHRLTASISQIVDDYSMVSYLPLNMYDEDSCDHVLYTVSSVIQYGEDHDVYSGGDDNDGDDNDYTEPPDQE